VLTTVIVSGQFTKPDDVTPAKGQVTFTIKAPMLDVNGHVIVPRTPIRVPLSPTGHFSTPLVATDSVDVEPADNAYDVKVHLEDAKDWQFSITVPADSPGGTLDLSAAAPSTATPNFTYVLQSVFNSHVASGAAENVHPGYLVAVPGPGGNVAMRPANADSVWHVSTAGDDAANDGRSWGTAFRTVQKAQDVAAAQGGGKVKVGAGVYAPPATQDSNVTIEGTGWLTIFSTAVGTFTNITTFAASGQGQKVRDVTYLCTAVGAADGPVAIHTNSSTGYELVGIHVVGPFHQGVLAYHGKGTLRGGTFKSIGVAALGSTPGDAISIFGGYLSFSECLFLDCLQDAAYYAAGSSGQGHDCLVTGGPEGVQVRDACVRVEIHDWVMEILGSPTVVSFGAVVQLGCVGVSLHHNTAVSLGGTAPAFGFGIQHTNVRCSVNYCDVSGNFTDGIRVQTTGAAGTESLDCDVSNNSAYGVVRHSVFVAANEVADAVRNRSIGSGAEGIMHLGADCTLSLNRVRGSVGDGIRSGGDRQIVVGNRAKDGSQNGILVSGSHSTFTSNVCTGNVKKGIAEFGAADWNQYGFNECTGNGDATKDITVSGAHSRLPANLNNGRYTAQVGG
jgi:hypothetical protein